MTDFTVNDRRYSARRPGGGLVLGESVASARASVKQGSSASRTANAALAAGAQGPVPTDTALARQMGLQRLASQRVAYGGGGGSSSRGLSFATQRPRDPMFYWQQNNLPYDTNRPEDLQALRHLCRVLYQTHPMISSAIDIFSKWPMVGMEFVCKDPALVEFYSSLFFDQLDYEEYLPDIGREYWTVGEAWPLGSFNEDLGVWEADELLNPDDVFVEKSPFLRDPRFYIRLPETLRKVLTTGQPAHEYQALMRSYPELKHFVHENSRMPVSNILLKQLKFKADTFNPRGVPIMLRGLRAIIQEEMLNAAQDAIADRLYTPLILARIGASASDLGTQSPWVPTDTQLAEFEGALDAALAADFRVLTTHFAVQMDSVFGRESMPNFDADFERLAEKQLQVFGLSKTMLSGAGSGQTYAADALNRDLVSQLLSTYQRYIKRFVRDRMLVVAEAQEHYDYDERGGKRYPIMEEVLVVDEESGEKRVVEQPKLLVPDLKLQAMNMRDDESQRQFYEALRGAGVPISMKTRLVNVPIDFQDEIEQTREEQVQLAVEAQEVRKATYLRLRAANLPIPEDLQRDFEAKAMDAREPAAEPTRIPQMGVDDQEHSALAPTAEDMALPPGVPTQIPEGAGGTVATPEEMAAQQEGAQVIPLPRNQMMRPPESDEQRAGMPRPASVKVAAIQDPESGEVLVEGGEYDSGLMTGPRHIGMRAFAGVRKDVPLDEQHAPVEQTG